MKQLIRRLSRVSDSSSHYILLRQDRQSSAARSKLRHHRQHLTESRVPEGHLPVYVGEEMERFVVSAELLNHPVLAELLKISAMEYGYDQKGGLRIPCSPPIFRRIVDHLHRSGGELDLTELVHLASLDLSRS